MKTSSKMGGEGGSFNEQLYRVGHEKVAWVRSIAQTQKLIQ
jgi:hypothetical protein